MTIGTFTLIKNEAAWIGQHILNVLPFVDQMCFFDGNSNDGTLEIIKHIRQTHKNGSKITLVENRDPVNLQEDYVHLFNDCMQTLRTDLAWFLHPDMWVLNPERIRLMDDGIIAASVLMESYAGEPGGNLLKIVSGRAELWKNIYRLRNPDLGAHYFGNYGAADEDIYFSEITGLLHDHHGSSLGKYPYAVNDSGIQCLHFSDVRTYERRLSRMKQCLINQGCSEDEAEIMAPQHARVTLKDGGGFKFLESRYPKEMLELRERFRIFMREPVYV